MLVNTDQELIYPRVGSYITGTRLIYHFVVSERTILEAPAAFEYFVKQRSDAAKVRAEVTQDVSRRCYRYEWAIDLMEWMDRVDVQNRSIAPSAAE